MPIKKTLRLNTTRPVPLTTVEETDYASQKELASFMKIG
jgi:hypothetical protein